MGTFDHDSMKFFSGWSGIKHISNIFHPLFPVYPNCLLHSAKNMQDFVDITELYSLLRSQGYQHQMHEYVLKAPSTKQWHAFDAHFAMTGTSSTEASIIQGSLNPPCTTNCNMKHLAPHTPAQGNSLYYTNHHTLSYVLISPWHQTNHSFLPYTCKDSETITQPCIMITWFPTSQNTHGASLPTPVYPIQPGFNPFVSCIFHHLGSHQKWCGGAVTCTRSPGASMEYTSNLYCKNDDFCFTPPESRIEGMSNKGCCASW